MAIKYHSNIRLMDNILEVGTGSDLQLYHDGTDSWIENTNGDFYVVNNANGKDIILTCDDGSGNITPYITLDGSAAVTRMHKDMYIPEYIYHQSDDNTKFGFSAADTFKIHVGGFYNSNKR